MAWEGRGLELLLAGWRSLRRRPAPRALRAEVRQLEDRFGLNSVAMARLRWTVEPEAPVLELALGDVRSRLRP